jgi:hypothetical protein
MLARARPCGQSQSQSSGTSIASAASKRVHDPSDRAASTMRRPASVIIPAASRRATRSLLDRAQTLPGRRGENRTMVRSSSNRPVLPSIQPKQSASWTTSS